DGIPTYDYDDQEFFRNLVRIDLFTRNSDLVRTVVLDQDASLVATDSPWINGNELYGKTTLKGVRVEDPTGANESYAYSFDYSSINPADPFHEYAYHEVVNQYGTCHPWRRVDDYGYYNNPYTEPLVSCFGGMSSGIDDNTDDAAAWSLTKVIYPTGGWEEYEYENDEVEQNAAVSYWLYYDRSQRRVGLPAHCNQTPMPVDCRDFSYNVDYLFSTDDGPGLDT